MLTKRIIACLDMDGGRVVKGVKFKNLRDAGDPAECAAAHARSGADEIVLLDITATSGNRRTLLKAVARHGALAVCSVYRRRRNSRPRRCSRSFRRRRRQDRNQLGRCARPRIDRQDRRTLWLASRGGGHRCQACRHQLRWKFRGVRLRRTRTHGPGYDRMGAGSGRVRSGRDPSDFDGSRRNSIRI